MTARAVHWHEGMFLRPHHLQAATRHLAHNQHLSESWDNHHNWGIRDIVIDRDALGNHRLVIRRLRLRLRDGTVISIPEDAELPALELKPLFERENLLTIFLGVPVLHLGRPNMAGLSSTEAGRFIVEELNLEDENTGMNPQPIQLRRLNVRLLLSTQDHTGYEVLPLVRLEKTAGADGTPKIHEPYIPPVLACDGWENLQHGILQSVYDRMGRKIELLSGMMVNRSISVESQGPGDQLMVTQLRLLNEMYALLHIIAFARGVHPFTAYYELCRMVGQLAIFDPSRKTPELPRYDHDDLGGCFNRVRGLIDALLDWIDIPEIITRPFEGIGLRMQVAIEPSWLESSWQMYLGIETSLPTEKCVPMWTRGVSDMKIGSSQNVDALLAGGRQGLKLTYVQYPPPALPNKPGLLFFQLSRDSDEWQNVRSSLSLAIRLRRDALVGTIEGQKVFHVKTPEGQTTTVKFTLYVVKEDK